MVHLKGLPRVRSGALVAGVFLLSLVMSVFICFVLEQRRYHLERMQVSEFGATHTEVIAQSLERILSLSYAVTALVRQADGMIPNFQETVTELLPFYPGTVAVGLSPGGVVEDIFPRDHRMHLIGARVVDEPRYGWVAKIAQQTGKLQIAAPITLLRDKKVGAVGVMPIFLDDKDGKPVFWGFVTVSLHFSTLLEKAGFSKIVDKGYVYELWRNNEGGEGRQIIAQSTSNPLIDPVERTVLVSGAEFTLSIAPRDGWSLPPEFFINLLMGGILSTLLAYLVKVLLDLEQNRKKLEHSAFFDPLTNLPNRRLFGDRLAEALVDARQRKRSLAICYLDLDRFKPVNDDLGHEAGDFVLVQVARRMEACLRKGDSVSRVGGDEFIIILADIENFDVCQTVLKRVIEEIAAPITFQGHRLQVSASFGVAVYPRDGMDADGLVVYADMAMYESKVRNRHGLAHLTGGDGGATGGDGGQRPLVTSPIG